MDNVPIPIPPVEQWHISRVQSCATAQEPITNGTADDKHGVRHGACLDRTADHEPDEPYKHGVLPRESIGQKPGLCRTQQRTELQHSGHQPFPESCRRIPVRIDPRECLIEATHGQRDRYHALVVAYIRDVSGKSNPGLSVPGEVSVPNKKPPIAAKTAHLTTNPD